jgi:hypothetical protein
MLLEKKGYIVENTDELPSEVELTFKLGQAPFAKPLRDILASFRVMKSGIKTRIKIWGMR